LKPVFGNETNTSQKKKKKEEKAIKSDHPIRIINKS